MIEAIFNFGLLFYLGIGLGLYIIPHDNGQYVSCGFEDYNLFFIPFWLPAMFSENVMEFIEK